MLRELAAANVCSLVLVSVLGFQAGCQEGAGEPADAGPLVFVANWDYDMLSTDLQLDVGAKTGTATVVFSGASAATISFEVGDLEIESVSSVSSVSGNARALAYQREGTRLDVENCAPNTQCTISFSYSYSFQTDNNGVLDSGVTLLWPYHCGNLFPCKSTPDDGLTFTMSLQGVPDGLQAIYPASIPADAPSYMPAWAIGDYTSKVLGTTSAGTVVEVWYLPGGEADADLGTARLREIIEFYETTYGPYSFGDHVGSVAVDWGASNGYAAIEHHPFWHVSVDSMDSEVTQAHEAAHGWFGNGVRLHCWEDFVLAEGTVSYLAARAVEAVGGSEAADQAWAGFQRRLDRLEASNDTKIAWPSGCMEKDILDDGIFGTAAYMRGAFFFRALEARVGKSALDGALSAFYMANKNASSGMQDLLDVIKAETGYDPAGCADNWLRSELLPTAASCE